MIRVINDVFTEAELQQFDDTVGEYDNLFTCPHTEELLPCKSNLNVLRQHIIAKKDVPAVFLKLIEFQPVEYKNVEWWYNSDADTITRHNDCDGGLFAYTGVKRFPEMTYVYYKTTDLEYGGDLVLFKEEGSDDILEKISPVRNSLVIFDAKFEHVVEPYEGSRVSLVLNPWKTRPLTTINH